MRKLFFWQTWSPARRALYFFVFVLLVILGISIAVLELAGIDSLIGWDTFARSEMIRLPIEQFRQGPFNFTIDTDTNIFWQFFSGGESFIPVWAYYGYLGLMTLSVVMLVTIITYLKKFWYFIGASLLIAGLVSLQLELLFLFGSESKTGLIVAILLYIPFTYIFNRVRTQTPFFTRFATFAGLTLVFALLIYFFADISYPFLHIATSSIYLMMVLSMIFMLMVAHEILIAIIGLLTSAQESGGGNSLRHFLIFCTIYLGILLLAYLSESGLVKTDLIYINLFVLLLASAFLGIWGFRKRENQYSYLADFQPAGAFFYIAMMLAGFTTLALLMVTGNDPGKEVFRDFIVNGHLAFGIIFLLYVMANFIGPLGNNLPVHKILFKPTSMPYFTFRLVGLITFLGFILPAGTNVSIFQTRSAYFNSLGDMYMHINQPLFGIRYYEDGALYGFNNHKSNYSLGKFYANQEAHARAIPYFQKAVKKWPTPQAFVDLANSYIETNRKYDAIFALKDGHQTFPESYEILNNLGLTFNETNIIDSAYIFMNQAHEVSSGKSASSSNITGLLIKNSIDVNADSVIEAYADPEDAISRNNALVLKNQKHEPWEIKEQEYDSALSYVTSSVIFNQTVNKIFTDDSINTKAYHRYTRYPANSPFNDELEFAEALNLADKDQFIRAFRLINAVGNKSNDRDYFEIGGKWALGQNAPYVAAQYFSWSADRNTPGARTNLAIAYSENQQIIDAAALWEQLANDDNEQVQTTAASMLDIYRQNPSSLREASDEKRYMYLRYVISPRDTSSFYSIASNIKDQDIRADAYLMESKKLLELGRTQSSINVFSNISGLQLTDQQIYEQANWHDLELLAASRNILGLSEKINEGIDFDQEHLVEKVYYKALIKAYSEDTTAYADFEWVAQSNPFMEEAVVTSVQYISQYDRFRAYDLLINALEINPKSVRLLKAYILQCAETQLDSYAAISLEELKGLIPAQEYY
ncbi:MAG: hypothetical protein P8X57_01560, partial [Cyclobacteriaceae bacterium]